MCTLQALDIPLEHHEQELEDRSKFLAALADKYTVSGLPEPGPLPELAPLPEDEAIMLIQANERGRQARERAQAMRTFKRQRQLEDRRARSGVVCSATCFAALASGMQQIIYVLPPWGWNCSIQAVVLSIEACLWFAALPDVCIPQSTYAEVV